ncbi:MAG: metalloregulator ArsR/SmtB family transcription factor [Actinomycetota bacterium]|nr:metalloregulator ArsR/SmtB family transcription factor [Actinomycetota bacterium]
MPGVVDEVGVAAKLFRGLADPTRLAILLALLEGEQRVTDLVARLGCSQANVSGHLACLKECGLVADRPQGRAVFYRAAHAEVIDLLGAAEGLLERIGWAIDLCPNYEAAADADVAQKPGS